MFARGDERRRHAVNSSLVDKAHPCTPQEHSTPFVGKRRKSILYPFLLLILFSILYMNINPREIEVQSTISTTTTRQDGGHDVIEKLPNGTMSHHHHQQQQQEQEEEQQEEEQQDHCVIHVHGFHHSGTGVLRQTIYKSLGEHVASIHQDTHAQEDEGQHIQNVYPKFYQRRKFCSNKYYCPEMMTLVSKTKSHKLFRQWMRFWDPTKPFLIQKTPTMDVLFLEQMKVVSTVHAIIIRHPFSWRPPVAKRAQKGKDSGLFALCTWLDVWTHVLGILSDYQVQSFAIVNYEALVQHSDDISQKLNMYIQEECGIHVNQTTNERPRRLHLRVGNATDYLVPSKEMLRNWKQCEEDGLCHEFMNKLAPVVAKFGYGWDPDDYYNGNAHTLLYSSNKPPLKELVDSLNDLTGKYCRSA
jgi:hypothetical protein